MNTVGIKPGIQIATGRIRVPERARRLPETVRQLPDPSHLPARARDVAGEVSEGVAHLVQTVTSRVEDAARPARRRRRRRITTLLWLAGLAAAAGATAAAWAQRSRTAHWQDVPTLVPPAGEPTELPVGVPAGAPVVPQDGVTEGMLPEDLADADGSDSSRGAGPAPSGVASADQAGVTEAGVTEDASEDATDPAAPITGATTAEAAGAADSDEPGTTQIPVRGDAQS